jgi:hypothetical protein
MRVGDPGWEASAALLQRIMMMAEFIKEAHAEEFAEYWAAAYPGKARAQETLEYFTQPELIGQLVIQRAVHI